MLVTIAQGRQLTISLVMSSSFGVVRALLHPPSVSCNRPVLRFCCIKGNLFYQTVLQLDLVTLYEPTYREDNVIKIALMFSTLCK